MGKEFTPLETEMLDGPSKSNDIWDYWVMPNSAPRSTQVDVLNQMAALPSNIKYILCEVPVGGGKSPIALTYASFLGKGMGTSYIMTPQRILQKQYEDSFPDQVHSMYGKANYWCTGKRGLDCDVASDIKPKCENCPASQAFARIKDSPHVVLNYKLSLLYSELFPDDDSNFGVRDLMVFDECHTLENNLVNHRAISITKSKCEDMKIKWIKPDDMQHAHEWLKEVYFPAVDSRYLELDRAVKAIDNAHEFDGGGAGGGGLLPSEVQTKRQYKRITRHRELVKRMVARELSYLEKAYVLMRDTDQFQFKEIYGRNLFETILKPKANKFLFMSSTILNQKAFCEDLGIPMEETAMITVGSEFEPDNRPVYFMPTAKMAYGWNDQKDPKKSALRNKMSNKVKKLCNMHADESGVVHTGSFQIAKWLIGELEGNIPQRIVTHNPNDGTGRDELIEEFTSNGGKEPLLLVSPSVTEGLDLKGDIARFAIFAKVPYPFLGDEWVKRRLDLSDEWYKRQAMTAMIQGGGRVVRTPDDWGNTYILDESFGYLWNSFKSLTPEWWKEAFSKVN